MEKVITAHQLQGTGIDSASKYLKVLDGIYTEFGPQIGTETVAESEKRLLKAVENAKNLKPIVSNVKQTSVEDIVKDKIVE